MAVGWLALAGAAQAERIDLADGEVHVIDDDRFAADGIYLDDALDGSPTKLVILEGGRVFFVAANGGSRVELNGGFVERDLVVTESATLAVFDGFIGRLLASERSRVAILGGRVAILDIGTLGLVSVHGGEVPWMATGFGPTYVYGGVIGDEELTGHQLRVRDFSSTYIFGGQLKRLLVVQHQADAFLIGHSFQIDGSPAPYGPVTSGFGQLEGVLANGENVDVPFTRTSASLNLLRPVDVSIGPVLEIRLKHRVKFADVEVALLGSESLDVSGVAPESLAFGPGSAAALHKLSVPSQFLHHLRDVNADGILDLVTHYDVEEADLAASDLRACLFAADATSGFGGCDALERVVCDGPPAKRCD